MLQNLLLVFNYPLLELLAEGVYNVGQLGDLGLVHVLLTSFPYRQVLEFFNVLLNLNQVLFHPLRHLIISLRKVLHLELDVQSVLLTYLFVVFVQQMGVVFLLLVVANFFQVLRVEVILEFLVDVDVVIESCEASTNLFLYLQGFLLFFFAVWSIGSIVPGVVAADYSIVEFSRVLAGVGWLFAGLLILSKQNLFMLLEFDQKFLLPPSELNPPLPRSFHVELPSLGVFLHQIQKLIF